MALFGLVDESRSHNNFFMFDGENSIGVDGQNTYGPDAVLSMLNFYLSQHFNGEEILIIYCDNCRGRNQNRFLMGYCVDSVRNGRYKEVQVHFLPVGHTNFSPDGFFGLFKRIFRRSTLDLPSQLRHTVGDQVGGSSTFVKGNQEVYWSWYDWKAYLEPRYDTIKGFQGSYHFRLTHTTEQGVVLEYSYTDGVDEKEVVLEFAPKQRKGKASEERERRAERNPRPAALTVAGPSENRETQLLDDISQHVSFDKKLAFRSYIQSIAPRKIAQKSKRS
ncbi:hypothetical protein RvY_00276 [Ramazzottius varieornatus]|uniref:DUF7869 domain-containing protein n=1 Tax=Ramazzottius varieornatus TaxID=947166 RepID=A0A1D1UMQ4_RAMVA|nr:hypothetical protein RvY_00276 [Ramazzottius varieornatus]